MSRREEILTAALSCFLDKGFERTTLGDIRARSGASTGSIYHFFAGKRDLFGQLVVSIYVLPSWAGTGYGPGFNAPVPDLDQALG